MTTDLEKLKKDPDFQKLIAEQAQKQIDEALAIQRLNVGELYGVLKEVYLSEGKDKMKKDVDENGKEIRVPQIDPSTGEVAKYEDRHLLTFANTDLGSKQFEVSKELYNLYQKKIGQEFIIIYELDTDRFDARRISIKVNTIKTVEQYRNTKESENE